MNGDASQRSDREPRSASLALACVVVWLAAAASAGPLGIWPAIGGAAVALGVAVLLFDRPAATALLRPSPRLVLLGAAAGGLMAAATYLLYPVLARLVPFIATDTARLYAAFRAPSPVVASRRARARHRRRGAGLARRRAGFARPTPWSLERRHAGSGRVCARARASRLAGPGGGRVLCGLAWGTLRATTASLVPSLVAHLLWDVLVLLWLPLK